jgi:hypothetical protein
MNFRRVTLRFDFIAWNLLRKCNSANISPRVVPQVKKPNSGQGLFWLG